MSSKKTKSIHAKRNADLCRELLNGKVYLDWVITTAFYAAIHLVENKIFPVKINGSNCTNITEIKIALNAKGRHQAREMAVWRVLPAIGAQYKWLDDNSRNARYITYKISPAMAEKAESYLALIEEDCLY